MMQQFLEVFLESLRKQSFSIILLLIAVVFLGYKENEHTRELQTQVTQTRDNLDSLHLQFIHCMVQKSIMYEEILKNRELLNNLITQLNENNSNAEKKFQVPPYLNDYSFPNLPR